MAYEIICKYFSRHVRFGRIDLLVKNAGYGMAGARR
jgi:hypothetical protein